MIADDYVNKGLMSLLLEKGCFLDKVFVQDFRPIWYTKEFNDQAWQDCDAYFIPTQSQVMKWLRNMGIVIEITTCWPSNPDFCMIPYCFRIEDYRKERDLTREHGKYYTGYCSKAGMDNFLEENHLLFEELGFGEFPAYEIACDASIKYCLMNLI